MLVRKKEREGLKLINLQSRIGIDPLVNIGTCTPKGLIVVWDILIMIIVM